MKRYVAFLFLIASGGMFADSFDSLASALKNLGSKPKPESLQQDAGLLGPWLLMHQRGVVAAYDEAYGGNKNVRIYQIKV